MGLDVFFRRDIANILRATACASEGSASLALKLVCEAQLTREADPEKLMQIYRQGVRHTLVSVGLAFGLEPMTNQQGDKGPIWIESLANE